MQATPLVVFGKSGDVAGYQTTLKSALYKLSREGICEGSDPNAGNGRLFTDGCGVIYQRSTTAGALSGRTQIGSSFPRSGTLCTMRQAIWFPSVPILQVFHCWMLFLNLVIPRPFMWVFSGCN